MAKNNGFTTDYSDVNDEYGLIPAGQYEAIIKNIEERTTPNGATGLNLSLVIRNDVEQSYQNRYLFHTLWKRREPTEADMQVQGYSFKQVMILAKSAALPSGKAYKDVHELCADLIGHVLRVTVAHEEYNNNTHEIIKYMNESKVPDCRHVFKEKPAVTAETVAKRPPETFAGTGTPAGIGGLEDFEEIIGDDDVPF